MDGSKHTPGPWTVSFDREWNAASVHSRKGILADVHRSQHCEANVRLIAAAPDMSEALGRIAGPELFNIAVNDVAVSPERMRALLGEIYELARNATNKVEGR